MQSERIKERYCSTMPQGMRKALCWWWLMIGEGLCEYMPPEWKSIFGNERTECPIWGMIECWETAHRYTRFPIMGSTWRENLPKTRTKSKQLNSKNHTLGYCGKLHQRSAGVSVLIFFVSTQRAGRPYQCSTETRSGWGNFGKWLAGQRISYRAGTIEAERIWK